MTSCDSAAPHPCPLEAEEILHHNPSEGPLLSTQIPTKTAHNQLTTQTLPGHLITQHKLCSVHKYWLARFLCFCDSAVRSIFFLSCHQSSEETQRQRHLVGVRGPLFLATQKTWWTSFNTYVGPTANTSQGKLNQTKLLKNFSSCSILVVDVAFGSDPGGSEPRVKFWPHQLRCLSSRASSLISGPHLQTARVNTHRVF